MLEVLTSLSVLNSSGKSGYSYRQDSNDCNFCQIPSAKCEITPLNISWTF